MAMGKVKRKRLAEEKAKVAKTPKPTYHYCLDPESQERLEKLRTVYRDMPETFTLAEFVDACSQLGIPAWRSKPWVLDKWLPVVDGRMKKRL